MYHGAVWDPDGPGPAPEQLVVAGPFTIAGDIPAAGIAAWDGSTWRGLGDGLTGQIYTLTVQNDALIIGGDFETSGHVRNLARLSGGVWEAIGTSFDEDVVALAIHDDELIVASSVGTYPYIGRVRRWDGAAWRQLGPDIHGIIQALTSFNGDLIAGGYFPGFANYVEAIRWDGAAWASMPPAGGNARAVPYAFTVFRGELIAGCGAIGPDGAAVRWNGSGWQSFGAGLIPKENNNGITIESLAVFGDRLIASGQFCVGTNGVGVAQWDGASWQPWPAESSTPQPISFSALVPFHGDLIVGGGFDAVGSHSLNSVARWDGQSWHAMTGTPIAASSSAVGAATPFGGGFVVGGTFHLETATGTAVNVALWDGEAWRPLGSGLGGWSGNRVSALTPYAGDLIAGGELAGISSYIIGVARWSGSAWTPLGQPINAVYALGHFNGELIAAGEALVSLGNDRWASIAR